MQLAVLRTIAGLMVQSTSHGTCLPGPSCTSPYYASHFCNWPADAYLTLSLQSRYSAHGDLQLACACVLEYLIDVADCFVYRPVSSTETLTMGRS